MSANDEASGNTPTSPTKNMGNDSQLSKTINLDFRRLFETGNFARFFLSILHLNIKV